MRKLYFLFVVLLCVVNPAIAQVWMNLGPSDQNQPSYYQANYTSMAVGSDGSLYAAYIDIQNQNRVTVSRYNSGTWSILGTPGFSAANVQYVDVAVGGDGVPYVVYQLQNAGDPFQMDATVMSFNGSSWSVVGTANAYHQASFNNAGATYWPGIDIAVGPAPGYDPYIAYQDYNATFPLAGTVRRFDGSNWVLVGDQGFTSTITFSQATKLVLEIAPDGVPYMLFLDNSGSGNSEMSVVRFNGTTWEFIGGQGFSTANFGYPAMDFSGGDFAVYVAYRDNVNLNEVTAQRFDGATWTVLGTAGFSDVNSDNVSIAVTSNGTPYVAYRETATNRARVEVFDFGTNSWNDATPGSPDVSADAVDFIRLVMGASNTPHIIYRDASTLQKASVKSLTGGEWAAVGNTGFSNGPASYTSAAIGNDGGFYVAYRDVNNLNRATVRKYMSGTWSILPTVNDAGFTGGAVEYVSLAINPITGDAYVAFRDGDNGNEATVYVEAPDGWGFVGAPAFSAGTVTYTSLAFSSTGVPYLAFADGANGNEVTVMTYNGTNWVNLGTAGFSNSGAASYVSLAIAPDGTPYVAYQSSGTSDEISVRRFASGNWNLVGPDGFSPGVANHVAFAINSAGTPYVAYQNGNDGEALVQMFDGGTWVTVGSADFSDGEAINFSLDFDNSNNPVVAYQDQANGNRLTVQKFVSGSWTVQGEEGVSAGTANYVSMAVNSGGSIYVAYSDGNAWAQSFESGVLPVNLTEFIVSKDGNKARLKWQTASEINSAYFILEHSTNGSDFAPFGRVDAAGNSSYLANYSYMHNYPVKGINYYRLKQVDIDGRETIFPIRKINFADFEYITIAVYPNPVKDKLNIQTSLANIKEVVITGSNGQRVYQKQSIPGSNHDVNVANLPDGVYILTVTDGKNIRSIRFVKN